MWQRPASSASSARPWWTTLRESSHSSSGRYSGWSRGPTEIFISSSQYVHMYTRQGEYCSRINTQNIYFLSSGLQLRPGPRARLEWDPGCCCWADLSGTAAQLWHGLGSPCHNYEVLCCCAGSRCSDLKRNDERRHYLSNWFQFVACWKNHCALRKYNHSKFWQWRLTGV